MTQLKDVLNMTDYLQNDCYCEGEIYSQDGFFFQVFEPEAECKVLGSANKVQALFVVATAEEEGAKPSLLAIFVNEDGKTIDDITRFDATDNNIRLAKEFIAGRTEKARFDEYEPGSTAKGLDELLHMADAIIVD